MALSLTGTPDPSTIKQFTKRGAFPVWLKECDPVTGGTITTGDGTLWQCIGYTEGTEIGPMFTKYTVSDDSGAKVVNESTRETAEVKTTMLNRSANYRNFTSNAEGKTYQMVIQGQDMSTVGTVTTTEFWAFAICKVDGAFSYKIGGDGKISGVVISTIANSAAITVTPPTTLTASTLQIDAGKMWATADLTHA